MLASACPNGKLEKWFSLHPEDYLAISEYFNEKVLNMRGDYRQN